MGRGIRMGELSRMEARKRKLKEAKERQKKEKARQAKVRMAKQVTLSAVALFVVALLIYWAYGRIVERPTWTSVPIMPKYHLSRGESPPPYNTEPPTSGPHTPYLASWGIHREPIPKEVQVHNLEDGGVLVQYRCPEGCPDLVEKLEAIVKRFDKAVLAPYPGMEKKIALTAWGVIDKFDDFDEKRIIGFIKAHIGIDHH